MIIFGTDGWRGLIARDFTFDNVRLVALATANYLLNKAKDGAKLTVVLGYDTRFLSRQFAEEAAMVLASKGITAYVADDISSTPQVSYCTKLKKADIGVVITASHNPAIYNGYKLKATFGGPSIPEEIAGVEAELRILEANAPEFNLEKLDAYVADNRIIYFDAKAPYLKHVKSVIDIDAIQSAGFKILYDPMHGAGIETMELILDDVAEIHADYNPGFGEIDHPEPIGECLEILCDKVQNDGYDVGIATDGDADRVGAVDNEGTFVDSHKIFMILLKYLYEVKKLTGMVVKTVSLTTMVETYCKAQGIEFVETPVGFKYAAKYMSEGKVLIGGEESGGLGTIIHIPERDGIFNALLLLEVMAVRKMSLKALCEELDAEFGPHRYARRDVVVSLEQKAEILAAAEKSPAKLGKYDVLEINKRDGFKFIVDKGWLLIRASGTEPLIRFYAEADSMEKVNELLDEGFKLK